MRKIISLVLLAAFLFYPVYAQSQDAKSRYRIQPTDVLTITVHDQPDLTTKTRVTQDGYISFPLLGKVMVRDLTVQELEQNLKELLEKDYLVKAEALVFIEEYHSRQISVTGEVGKPGKFNMPIERDITLLDGIAMAEGFTKDADVNKTKVMRVEDGREKTFIIKVKDITDKDDKQANITLKAGDIIVVPKRAFFSVIGEAKTPGKFNMPVERNVTLLEAIAMAEGFAKDADLGRVKVMRIEDGEQRNIPVNVKAIVERDEKDKNIVLKPDDIVFIPKLAFFSVTGEVSKPGKFDMPTERSITLLESVAMAGGFTKDADLGKVKIMRVEKGEKKTITVNIKDITERDQKDKDIVLQSDDIVYVPESFF